VVHYKRLGISNLKGSSADGNLLCAEEYTNPLLVAPMEIEMHGKPRQTKAHASCSMVINYFVSKPGFSYLLPSAMKLWQVNLLACKQGKI